MSNPYRSGPPQPRTKPRHEAAWDKIFCKRWGHRWKGGRCSRCLSEIETNVTGRQREAISAALGAAMKSKRSLGAAMAQIIQETLLPRQCEHCGAEFVGGHPDDGCPLGKVQRVHES